MVLLDAPEVSCFWHTCHRFESRTDSPMIMTLRPVPLLSSAGNGGGFSAAITAAVGPDGPLISRARRGRRLFVGICRCASQNSAYAQPCTTLAYLIRCGMYERCLHVLASMLPGQCCTNPSWQGGVGWVPTRVWLAPSSAPTPAYSSNTPYGGCGLQLGVLRR